jgi:hypothetical protein
VSLRCVCTVHTVYTERGDSLEWGWGEGGGAGYGRAGSAEAGVNAQSRPH